METLIPNEPYEVSKDAAAFIDALNADWGAAQARRARHKQEGERLAALDPLEFTPADAKAKRRLREEAVEILQSEIPLLRRYAKWPDLRQRERGAAWDRARARAEAAAETIKRKLTGIGFDPAAFAQATADDPQERARAADRAAAMLDDVAYLHPSVIPHLRMANHLGTIRNVNSDVEPERIRAMIATAEDALRKAIADI